MTVPKNIYAFTDGASRGNPGPGGWGAVVVDADKIKELGGHEDKTTNNRMELSAIIEVLKSVKAGKITIFTDSGYAIKGATKWIENWKKNGWQTKQKTDVMNSDLWQELDPFLSSHDIEWRQVGGHVGLPGNERADKIATSFADKKETGLFKGEKSKYGVDVEEIKVDESAMKERSEKRERQAMKAYSYVTMVDGEIKTHQTWPEAEARVKGKKASYRKSVSPEDESEIIREFKQMG